MENRVYICSWDHVGDRYQAWVRDRPSVRAEGASFEQADIALADAICGAFGDGEGVHEGVAGRDVEVVVVGEPREHREADVDAGLEPAFDVEEPVAHHDLLDELLARSLLGPDDRRGQSEQQATEIPKDLHRSRHGQLFWKVACTS